MLLLIVVSALFWRMSPETFSLKNWSWPGQEIVTENIETVGISNQDLLAAGPGKDVVLRHCTGCHSAELIRQNRMDRERWVSNIKWMQETQGLWDLGTDEVIVLDYLSTYYSPTNIGRRGNLNHEDIAWYILNE